MQGTAALHVETIQDQEEFHRLKPEWDALLCALGERGSVFMSHCWYFCWWKHFGSKTGALNLLLVRQGGELVGIFPLMRLHTVMHGLPVHCLSFMENKNSLHNDLLVAPHCRDAVLSALLSELYGARQNWDVLVLNNIPGDSPDGGRLSELLREGERSFLMRRTMDSPYLDISGGWDKFLSSRSTRVRKTLRNIQNSLERFGKWEVLELKSYEQYLQVREGILEVARNSWTKQIGDSLADRMNAEFFEDLAQMAAKMGWLSVWLLRLDGREVAFEFHLRGLGKQHALRASYDESFARLSPGAFLEMQALKRLFQWGGVARLDFGGSFDSYKKRWSDNSRPLVSLQVFNQRPYSRLLAFHEKGLVPLARGVRDLIRSRNEGS